MSSFADRFKTNKSKETEGVWFTIHENEDGTLVQFQIARTGTCNLKYMKAVERLTKPYRSSMRNMPAKLVVELNRKAYLETCVHAWKNVSLNGKDNLGFSQDNLKLVCNELPDVLELLMEVSADSSYYQDSVEEDVKNSPPA
jgi:hypothetical protein